MLKPEPTAKIGVGFLVASGSLKIYSIDPTRLFSQGILNVGDKVVRIGDVPRAVMDSESAVALIHKEEKMVTIVARTDQEVGLVVASSNRACAPWKRTLIIFLVIMLIFLILAYFLSERRWSAPTPQHAPPCTNLYGAPTGHKNCQD